MPYPSVSVQTTNGNLLRTIAVLDGVGALVVTVATPGLIGNVQVVYSLNDAITKGYTAAAEPFAYKLISEFYQELGGNQALYVMGTAETDTMTDVVDSTNNNGLVKLLTASSGVVNLVAIARNPVTGYNAGVAFLDSDVSAAVTMSKTLCSAWQAKNKPLRIFIEGRVANGSVANIYSPSTATNGYAGVVLGGTSADGTGAVTLALARAVKYGAQIKLGDGRNGALTATQIYIGADKLEDRLDAESLHDQGFITFMHRDGVSGYYFGVDYMASSDDYNILVHGRAMDKAQRIVAQALIPYVENDIDVNADGSPSDDACTHMEGVATQAINANMGKQISKCKVVIDNTQGSSTGTSGGIINTSTLMIQVQVLPKGYLTWLIVNMGLTSSLS